MTGPRIRCVGFWHDDNRGDAAIASATVGLLRERWPSSSIEVQALQQLEGDTLLHATRHLRHAHPDVTIRGASVLDEVTAGGGTGSRVRRWAGSAKWLAALAPDVRSMLSNHPTSSLEGFDLVVYLGGSDIYDDPDVVAPLSLARLATVLAPLHDARVHAVPAVLFGHTIGPFDRASGRWLVSRLVGPAVRCTVRERRSVETAHGLGWDPVVVPDVAFSLQPRRTPRVDAILRQLGGNFVALVVRQHPHAGARADARVVDEMAGMARQLLDDGSVDRVAVVVQTTGPTTAEDDRPLSRALAALLPSERTVLVDTDLPPDELAAVYGACRAVVTVRLHGAILALAAGTPAFAISYFSEKTAGVVEQVPGAAAWTTHDAFDAASALPTMRVLLTEDARVSAAQLSQRATARLREEVAGWNPLYDVSRIGVTCSART